MSLVTIVYHSGSGHTQKQAKYVYEGAESVAGITAKLINVGELTESEFDILSTSDAIIFGSPTYMGSVSAPFKAFMDSTSKLSVDQKWKDKISAGFTNSKSMSGDKLNTLIQLAVFSAQHGMIWVGQPERNASPDGYACKEEAINRMGSFLGAMAQSENAPADITPPIGDLKTAELLGVRVAKITKKFLNS